MRACVRAGVCVCEVVGGEEGHDHKRIVGGERKTAKCNKQMCLTFFVVLPTHSTCTDP